MLYNTKNYDIPVIYNDKNLIMQLDISYTNNLPDKFVEELEKNITNENIYWYLYNYLEKSKNLNFNESYINIDDMEVLVKHWKNEIIKF